MKRADSAWHPCWRAAEARSTWHGIQSGPRIHTSRATSIHPTPSRAGRQSKKPCTHQTASRKAWPRAGPAPSSQTPGVRSGAGAPPMRHGAQAAMSSHCPASAITGVPAPRPSPPHLGEEEGDDDEPDDVVRERSEHRCEAQCFRCRRHSCSHKRPRADRERLQYESWQNDRKQQRPSTVSRPR